MKKLTIVTTLFFTLFTLDAWAAGYQLRYQGAEAMGTSFASQGTYGTSLSSIYFNPALFLKQDKKQALAVEGMAIVPMSAEFTSEATGKVYDEFADNTFTGSLFYGHRFNDTTALTVALTTPWGTNTEYPKDWEGRVGAIKTQLSTLNLQPVVSKMFNEKWAVSVGPQIQMTKGTLSGGVPGPPEKGGGGVLETKGDNMGFGAVLAVTFMPNDHLTFNFTYNSKIEHTLSGEVTIDSPRALASDAELEISTPDIVSLGASHVYNEKWVSHFNFSYTTWSLLETIDIENTPGDPAAGKLPTDIAPVPQNWQDTYLIALGATHIANDKWTFRGGLSYETSAVENKDRTPRTQDSDRVGVGLGGSYKLADAFNLDFGFNQIIYLGDVEITNPAAGGGVTGEYDNSASLFRVGLEYMF